MGERAEAVVDAALRLPKGELEAVVERLLASLDAAEDEDVDAAWAAEAERRLAELRRGEAKAVPWAEVKASAVKRSPVGAAGPERPRVATGRSS